MARNVQIPPADPFEPQSVEVSDAPSPLIVDVARIQPYERNPRHGRNPEYDRIKDSIRSNGLDQPLVITQRPGAADYIVHAGGNTRLLILKELYEETGDERFSRIQCVFRPWRRESDVLLAHLRENDLRGSLTFIDKARAIHRCKAVACQGVGCQRDFNQKNSKPSLRKAGYRIASRPVFPVMAYAVERLLH